MHREIEGETRTLNISHDGSGKWYASFSVKQESVTIQPEKTGNSIGIDACLLHLATMSDGTVVDPPKFLKKGEKRIKKAQRNLSHKKKGSNNQEKAKISLSKQHQKVKNQREDFAHKLSNQMVQNNDLIVFEDLNITGMMKNHHLAKSIADASWNKLVQYTTYKTESAGKEVVLVDPRSTSRECSNCGYREQELKLSTRVFRCDHCGFEIDRDLNAAINIHNRALEKVGRGTPEVTPVEIRALPEKATQIAEAGSPVP
jgi:putative transposase